MKLFVSEKMLTKIYSEGFRKGIEVGYNVGVKTGRGEAVIAGMPTKIEKEIEEILRRGEA